MILKSIFEIDRVLKYCGFVAITDFDTPFKMMRNNVHNSELPVFKGDYSDLFIKLATDSDAATKFVNGIVPTSRPLDHESKKNNQNLITSVNSNDNAATYNPNNK